jgi:hypothetical protein
VAEGGSPTREERRAKREARRAKQRAENAGRAAKMQDARLAWEAEGHSAAAQAELGRVHVGCSGWFYWHWRGGFYPADLPTGDWFAHPSVVGGLSAAEHGGSADGRGSRQ